MDSLRRQPAVPRDMAVAPPLGPVRAGRKVQPHTALLVNPFYAKDPRASFGKHVLTATLGLDEHRRRNAAALGGALLGRESAAGLAARGSSASRRRHLGASHVREARV
jgi:hypothetical protein